MIDDGFWVFLVAAVALLAFAGFGLYAGATSPHYMLKKSDWGCTEYRPLTYLQAMHTGQTVTMIPVTHMECSVYKMRGE